MRVQTRVCVRAREYMNISSTQLLCSALRASAHFGGGGGEFAANIMLKIGRNEVTASDSTHTTSTLRRSSPDKEMSKRDVLSKGNLSR